MLQDGVRQDNVGEHVTVLNHVNLVEGKVMVDDKDFINQTRCRQVVTIHCDILVIDWDLPDQVDLKSAVCLSECLGNLLWSNAHIGHETCPQGMSLLRYCSSTTLTILPLAILRKRTWF